MLTCSCLTYLCCDPTSMSIYRYLAHLRPMIPSIVFRMHCLTMYFHFLALSLCWYSRNKIKGRSKFEKLNWIENRRIEKLHLVCLLFWKTMFCFLNFVCLLIHLKVFVPHLYSIKHVINYERVTTIISIPCLLQNSMLTKMEQKGLNISIIVFIIVCVIQYKKTKFAESKMV